MAKRMPSAGYLQLRSELPGLSARYSGPGLKEAGGPVALVHAQYEDNKLFLRFDKPVKIHSGCTLQAVLEFSVGGTAKEVADIFDDNPLIPEKECVQTLVVPVKPKSGAPSQEYALKLHQRVLQPCKMPHDTATDKVKIPGP